MKPEWPESCISELQAAKKWALNGGPFGSKLVSRDYIPTGVPVIRGVNLPADIRFHMGDFVYVSEEKADELLPNNAHPGDVIFTQRGTLGQVGIIPINSPFNRFVISQSQMKITVDSKKTDALWLYYAFRSPLIQQELINRASSSGVPHINLETLRDFKISIPPIPIQTKIAAILSAYDDLIENNTRRIKILEEMAQAIYREWFVNFRFPGHEKAKMGNSPMGKIPEGWEIKNLFEIADVTYGFPFKSELFNEDKDGMPVVRIRDVLNGQSTTFTTEEVPDKYIVNDGDFLVGMDGDFHMGAWAGGTSFLVQRVARFRPRQDVGRHALALSLKDPIEHFNKTIIGTTVAHLGDKHLRTINMIIPDKKIIKLMNSYLEPLLEFQLNIRIKNRNLHQTRDLLLPKLISGELDVSDMDIKADKIGNG